MRTEFKEPVWVGMDVEAELAALAEEDRRAAAVQARRKRAVRRGGLRRALSALGKRVVPRLPLPA